MTARACEVCLLKVRSDFPSGIPAIRQNPRTPKNVVEEAFSAPGFPVPSEPLGASGSPPDPELRAAELELWSPEWRILDARCRHVKNKRCHNFRKSLG